MTPLLLGLKLGVAPAVLAALGARLSARLAAIGAGAGLIAAYINLHGLPRWPPPDATAWIVPATLAGLIWAALPTHRLAWLGRWAYATALLGLVLRLWVERTGAPALAGILVLGLALSLGWTTLARARRPLPSTLGLGLTLAIAAAALGQTGSARLAMLSGVLAIVVVSSLAARRGERQRSFEGILPVVVPGYAILLATGTIYGELPTWAGLALLAAPLAMGWGLCRWGAATGGGRALRD